MKEDKRERMGKRASINKVAVDSGKGGNLQSGGVAKG